MFHDIEVKLHHPTCFCQISDENVQKEGLTTKSPPRKDLGASLQAVPKSRMACIILKRSVTRTNYSNDAFVFVELLLATS
mmetsp:Transcript_1572/g.2303  ORF Transcript_1572/g.2303 Transcript_1572/m.2303 type:complete len:80 (-) Transcript_1572:1138-1377(-)